MNYMSIEKENQVNGLGIRTVLWISGCEHGCIGCHNKITWNHNAGLEFDDIAIQEIYSELEKDYVSGTTFSGGDPLSMENRTTILDLAKKLKEKYPNKNIWCYTGYTFESISHLKGIEYIDVLVDGKYIQGLDKIKPQWRGSSNQRIIDVKASLLANKIVSISEDL